MKIFYWSESVIFYFKNDDFFDFFSEIEQIDKLTTLFGNFDFWVNLPQRLNFYQYRNFLIWAKFQGESKNNFKNTSFSGILPVLKSSHRSEIIFELCKPKKIIRASFKDFGELLLCGVRNEWHLRYDS